MGSSAMVDLSWGQQSLQTSQSQREDYSSSAYNNFNDSYSSSNIVSHVVNKNDKWGIKLLLLEMNS